MTNNLLALDDSILARICADFAYADDLDALAEYFRAELMIPADATISNRDDLIAALDRDICDMLHNCNLDMLFPADDIDALDRLNPYCTLDTHDFLADRILNSDRFLDTLADHILRRA